MSANKSIRLLAEFNDVMDAAFEEGPHDIETLYTLVATDLDDLLAQWDADLGESGGLVTRTRSFLMKMLHHDGVVKSRVDDLKTAFHDAHDRIFTHLHEQFWRAPYNTAPYNFLNFPEAVSQFGEEGVAIFTTNYDRSLETFFSEELHMPFDRGERAGRYDPEALVRSPQSGVRLVKLHGSMDFYDLNTGSVAIIKDHRGPGPWYGDESVTGVHLIPPEEGKIDYSEGEQMLFELFAKEVAEAKILLVIGTSLRDDSVVEVLQGAPSDGVILLWCGSRSEELASLYFSDKNVLPDPDYFPTDRQKDILTSLVGARGA